jgi:membrane fusion protein, multidrug efflux system
MMVFAPKKGMVRDKSKVLLCSGILVLTVSACSKEPAPPKAARPPVPVLVDTATSGDVPVLVNEFGNAVAFSNVVVRSRAGGTLLRAHFKEGDDVRRDQLLFEIDPDPYEAVLRKAEADLLRDQALSQNAEVEARRYEELVKKDYVTRREADEARARADALKATLKADEAAIAEARLNLGYCSVRSPLDGRTGELITYPGNVVRANETPLVAIQQVSPIWVSFAVPEVLLSEIRRAQAAGQLSVQATVPGSGAIPEKGKLDFLDSQVSSRTGTILLKAVFDNARRVLWPGQYVNVSLTLAVRRSQVMVPSQAIQSGASGAFVFVISAEFIAERRSIIAGEVFGDRTIVEKGLQPGERVVTDGQMNLTNGAKVELKKAL